MECDSDHSLIEKQKKRHDTLIEHPHNWAQLARIAAKNKPFVVDELTLLDFRNFSSLLKTNLQLRKVTKQGEKVTWADIQ